MEQNYKICAKCKTIKTINQFYWRDKANNTRRHNCKECHAKTAKTWRANNIGKVVNYRNNRRDEIRACIDQRLQGQKCMDCGENRIILLQFDHVRGIKEFSISESYSIFPSITRLVNEMNKCDLRCGNCHTKKSAIQYGWCDNNSKNANVINKFKQSSKCIDCGESDWLKLTFDHRYDKKRSIGTMKKKNISTETILCEIDKCYIRCMNCHMLRHYTTMTYKSRQLVVLHHVRAECV